MIKTRLPKRQKAAFAGSGRRVPGMRQLAACCAYGLFALSGTALATDAFMFNSSVVGPTLFDEIDIKLNTHGFKMKMDTKQPSDVYVVTNVVAPGGYSGWHTHPGPSLVSVKSGTATYYDGDDPYCTPHVVNAGEGFIDQGGGHVHMVRNEGAVTLELVAFQIVPVGAKRRDDRPRPDQCPF